MAGFGQPQRMLILMLSGAFSTPFLPLVCVAHSFSNEVKINGTFHARVSCGCVEIWLPKYRKKEDILFLNRERFRVAG